MLLAMEVVLMIICGVVVGMNLGNKKTNSTLINCMIVAVFLSAFILYSGLYISLPLIFLPGLLYSELWEYF